MSNNLSIPLCSQCQSRYNANIFDPCFYFFLCPQQFEESQKTVDSVMTLCCDSFLKWSTGGTLSDNIPGFDVDKMIEHWKEYLKCNRALTKKGIRDKRSAVLHWYEYGKRHNLQRFKHTPTVITVDPITVSLDSRDDESNQDDYHYISSTIRVLGWSHYEQYVSATRQLEKDTLLLEQEQASLQNCLEQEERHSNILTHAIREKQLLLQKLKKASLKRQKQKEVLEQLELQTQQMLERQDIIEQEVQELQELQNLRKSASIIRPGLNSGQSMQLGHSAKKPSMANTEQLQPTMFIEYSGNQTCAYLFSIFQHYRNLSTSVLLVFSPGMEYDFFIPQLSAQYSVPFAWSSDAQKNGVSRERFNFHAVLEPSYGIARKFFTQPQYNVHTKLNARNHIICQRQVQGRTLQTGCIIRLSTEIPRLLCLENWEAQKRHTTSRHSLGQRYCLPSEEYVYKYVDHIYVLNLYRRPDRFSATASRLQKEGIYTFEHFYAEDCRAVQYSLLFDTYSFYKRQKKLAKSWIVPSKGSFAILYSMYKMLMDAIIHNYDTILVFQDDLFFTLDFESKFTKHLRNAPNDWKLLYIGANDKKIQFTKQKQFLSPFYSPRGQADGAFAVLIRKCLFEPLLKQINFQRPFDSGPLSRIQEQFPKQAIVIFPNLVIADVSESDCRENRPQEAFSKRVLWDMRQFQTQIPTRDFGQIEIVVIATNLTQSAIENCRKHLRSPDFQNILGNWNIMFLTSGVSNESQCRSWYYEAKQPHAHSIRWYTFPSDVMIAELVHMAFIYAYSPYLYFQTLQDILQVLPSTNLYLQTVQNVLETRSSIFAVVKPSGRETSSEAIVPFDKGHIVSKYFAQQCLVSPEYETVNLEHVYNQFLDRMDAQGRVYMM